jgi:hypothetical protein
MVRCRRVSVLSITKVTTQLVNRVLRGSLFYLLFKIIIGLHGWRCCLLYWHREALIILYLNPIVIVYPCPTIIKIGINLVFLRIDVINPSPMRSMIEICSVFYNDIQVGAFIEGYPLVIINEGLICLVSILQTSRV